MNENEENKVEQGIDFKEETLRTFNEAKEQMKNINLKDEAEAGKSLLKDLFTSPIKTIKAIAEDKENKTFKTALLLVVLWAVIELMDQILYYATSKYAEFEFLPTLKVTLAPILKVIAMTVALFFVNNRAKDSISRVLTSVSIAHIPYIISSLIWLLYRVSSNLYDILTPISGILKVVGVVLMYHTVKEFAKDDEENVFKKFVKVEVVYFIIAFAISFLGISI